MPLTSIRAFAELMRDDPQMDSEQRQQFRQSGWWRGRAPEPARQPGAGHGEDRTGHAQWAHEAIDLRELIAHAVQTTAEASASGASVSVRSPSACPRCTPTATGCCRC